MAGTSKWTPEQQRAIEERDCNLLVAAAAGAGKTAVLVERILQRIMDEKRPVDIDRLLVVTFTNAAAAEMRERIGDALGHAQENMADRTPEQRSALQQRLQRQLTLLNKANITTIHSFCLEVIKNNFHHIDLDPGFRIADETEGILLKLEALEELFEARYEEGSFTDAFMQLVESYGGSRDDRMLQEMVLSVFEFVQSHPWPAQWLSQALQPFQLQDGADFGETKYAQVLKTCIGIELMGLQSSLEQAIDLLIKEPGLAAYLPIFHEDLLNLKQLIKQCSKEEKSWNGLYAAFKDIQFSTLPRGSKEADKGIQEKVKGARDEVKSKLKKLRDDVLYADSEAIIDELRYLYPMLDCLCSLVMDFEALFKTKKKEKGIIDFNDLEHYCLEILLTQSPEGLMQATEAALALRERFEEIFIDEYQDSNMVQEEILRVISRSGSENPNLFMVGDVKQSIYRFRQAKPELFMDKYNSYVEEGSGPSRKILLYKNFRSREEIIHAVNFIFGQMMSVNIGELDYNSGEALNLGACFEAHKEEEETAGGAVELHIIETAEIYKDEQMDELPETSDSGDEPPQGDEDAAEPPDLIRLEARVVIKRIKALMTEDAEGKRFKVFDKTEKAYRNVEYKDMVILLRATRNWAQVFAEEMALQGIPAYADTGSGYFQTVEIATVLALLQIIDNPYQDIPLLAVLRSPLVSFTAEELLDIRMGAENMPEEWTEAAACKEGTFYEAMLAFAKTKAFAATKEQREAAEKTADFINHLSQWREMARHMSTDQLLWFLYQETGYYSYVGVLPMGVQRQANLRILLERARQYEETSYKGLFNFIHFIHRLKSSKGDMGSAKTLGENDNVVKIMSIHKSKGLEFPVVFVSGTGKGFNLMDMNRKIIFHQELGFGPDFVDYKRRLSYITIPKHALRYKIKLESLSEEMRILYVAFTRAKEKLIITGSVRSVDKYAAKWKNSLAVSGIKLPEYEMLKGRCYLDWIGSALVRHKNGDLAHSLGYPEQKNENAIEDPSAWQVRLWHYSEMMEAEKQEEKNQADFLDKVKALIAGEETAAELSGAWDEVNRRLSWQYPYKEAEALPVKLTVTELKRRANTEFASEDSNLFVPVLVKKPRFLEEEKGFSAAEKGTLLHFVMQHLDLARIDSPKDIKAQLSEMVEKELMTKAEADTINIMKIRSFFQSELGRRLLQSKRVYREMPFNIEVNCREINQSLPEEIYGSGGAYGAEWILLQGVIDCYFEETDGIVLLDYKTDYVAEGNLDEIKDKYRVQIDYYQKALEHVTGKRVKEKCIYLFHIDKTVHFDLA